MVNCVLHLEGGTMKRAERLAALERCGEGKMIIAKLPAGGDLDALLNSAGIELQATGLQVRINRPEGCGSDFVRVI